jgi:hypothetical protein
MPIVANRHYNDPALGAAFGSIAQLFAPPSGSDMANYARAGQIKDQMYRAAQLYAEANNFDQRNVAAGNYAPTSSYYAVDTGDATDRRGQDMASETARAVQELQNSGAMSRLFVTDATDRRGQDMTAGTARAVQELQNSGALARQHAEPVITGEGEIAHIPGQTQQATGFGERLYGTYKPPTLEQAKGIAVQSTMTPEEIAVIAQTGEGVEKIIGQGGTPQIASRAGSIGQEPFIDKGSTAAPQTENWISPDAKTGGTAMFDPTSQQWIDTVSKQPIPAGSRTYTGQLSGGVDATGFGRSTESQNKFGYTAEMVEQSTEGLLAALDTPGGAKLPTEGDYQIFQIMRNMPEFFTGPMNPTLTKMMTPAGQIFYQHLRVALPAQLQAQSGAAVTEQEYQRKLTELLPIPGEDPAVSASKRHQFATFLRTASALAGSAKDQIDAEPTVKPKPVAAPVAADTPPPSYQGDPELWKFMPPEHRALWQ